MVGHGIGDQCYAQLCGDLLHDGGLTYTGCTQKKYGALAGHGDDVITGLILFQVKADCLFDKLLCFVNIHDRVIPAFSMPLPSVIFYESASSSSTMGVTHQGTSGSLNLPVTNAKMQL